MADNATQLIAAGLQRIDFHILDSTGIAAGPTGTVSTGATGAAAGRILGAQTAEIKIGEPETVNIPGDDGNQGSFIFGPADIPSFDIIVSVENLTHEGVFQGTNVFNDGSASFGVLDPGAPVYPDVAILAVSRSKSKVSGSDGVANYAGVVVPKCTIIPLGRDTYQGRTGAGFRYRVLPTRSDAYPWGLTLKDSVQGTPNGVVMPWSAPNPLTFHRWTGDNTTTTFNLGEKLASASANEFRLYNNTTLTTGGLTLVAAATSWTIAPAPATNAKLVSFYQYQIS
jgi:hypothetical protein